MLIANPEAIEKSGGCYAYTPATPTIQRLCNEVLALAQKQLSCTSEAAIKRHEHDIRRLNIGILNEHLKFMRKAEDIDRAHRTIEHLSALNAA